MNYSVNSFMIEFSTNLKKARMREQLTQKEIAEELGISISTYRNWEKQGQGHRTPELKTLIRLANTLNTTIDELVGR